MKILLSIKPQFAEKIFDGSKKFEFRRSIFAKSHVKTVVVYASSPLQRVIGEFEINQILFDDIESLWLRTHEHAGIDRAYFFQYFTDKSKGYAIEIKNVQKYRTPFLLKERFHIHPPQSFAYIS